MSWISGLTFLEKNTVSSKSFYSLRFYLILDMQFLQTPFGELAYKKHGNGKNIHLLFHGFGQTMKAFDSYLKLKTENDCFLVFDVFYHGHSSWTSTRQKLTKPVWKEILISLMEKEDFEKFHLVGYSMGGKFSLVTYELFPEKVISVLLMAPDGIKTGFWYNMATFPGAFNRLFKYVIFHPEQFFKWMDRFHHLGLLESSFIKFVKSQMGSRTMRAQIYFTWNVFKPLQPDLEKIAGDFHKFQTPITLVSGKFDKMVTSANLQPFSSKIPNLRTVELSCGHNTLIEETVDFLMKENSGTD